MSNACFLHVFVALEEFLEASFVHYLTGRMSTARWKPRKHARPKHAEHAQKMLRGVNRYVDWSTPDTVLTYADLYFVDGEPFRTALNGQRSHLLDMKTARNASAHLSTTTQDKLEGLFGRWTGAPKAGVSSYDLLLAPSAISGASFYQASEAAVQSVINNVANRN